MGVESNVAAAKFMGQSKCGHDHCKGAPSNANDVSLFLSQQFGLVRPGERKHTLNILEDGEVKAVVDVASMTVSSCSDAAFRTRVEKALARVASATAPVKAPPTPDPQQSETEKREKEQR